MRSGLALSVAIMSMVVATGCATGKAPRTARMSLAAPVLAVLNVGVEPKTLDVQQAQTATIYYELTRSASVTVDLVDEEGRVIRQLKAQSQRGKHTIPWDATAADGQLVAGGVYRYVIRAHAQSSEALYDPSTETGGEELLAEPFTFDAQTGAMEWVMPKAGYARLNIGLQGYPHLRTLVDWQPLEAGRQRVVWDGRDASGLMTLMQHPNLAMKLQTFALPWNTLIVRNSPTMSRSLSDEPRYPPLAKPQAPYLHARHTRAVCHAPRLRVDFPEAKGVDAQQRPIVSGVVPVRVSVHPDDAQEVVSSRFEVALYEDTVFLVEEQDGTNPFTYLWDTRRLSEGEHLLTVNIFTYDDHYGVLTRPVVIQKNL